MGVPLNEESHSKDFSYSITLFEKQCLPKPKLLLFNSIAPLVVILLMLLVMAAVAGKLSHIRLMVCERFFTQAAEDRVEHLHAEILRKRGKKKKEKTNSVNKLFLEVSRTEGALIHVFWVGCPPQMKEKVPVSHILTHCTQKHIHIFLFFGKNKKALFIFLANSTFQNISQSNI